MDELQRLTTAVAEVGRANQLAPPLQTITPFVHFFADGGVDRARLDARDGGCTRRELLTRALLLTAVLDQGPDITGVREMMVRVVNQLYENEVRIFHRPLDFFKGLNISVDEILHKHAEVKRRRAEAWARANETTPTKYNLYMDGSRQTLNYAIFRWGVPLALPYLLTQVGGGEQPTALSDYLESYDSAEKMSGALKDDEKFGLGKAIGDKACHLFTKWVVSTFQLARRGGASWGEFSFEVPYDSNAGRVLWRTGYLLALADEAAYRKRAVVQPNQGKGGKHYIRVTNMRGMPAEADVADDLRDIYAEVCVRHLQSHKRAPKKVEVQRFQHALLMRGGNADLTVAAFDDGLIEIGRNYCLNHDNPRCDECPIRMHCRGYLAERKLITEYRT